MRGLFLYMAREYGPTRPPEVFGKEMLDLAGIATGFNPGLKPQHVVAGREHSMIWIKPQFSAGIVPETEALLSGIYTCPVHVAHDFESYTQLLPPPEETFTGEGFAFLADLWGQKWFDRSNLTREAMWDCHTWSRQRVLSMLKPVSRLTQVFDWPVETTKGAVALFDFLHQPLDLTTPFARGVQDETWSLITRLQEAMPRLPLSPDGRYIVGHHGPIPLPGMGAPSLDEAIGSLEKRTAVMGFVYLVREFFGLTPLPFSHQQLVPVKAA
jgi:hypothetical protein